MRVCDVKNCGAEATFEVQRTAHVIELPRGGSDAHSETVHSCPAHLATFVPAELAARYAEKKAAPQKAPKKKRG